MPPFSIRYGVVLVIGVASVLLFYCRNLMLHSAHFDGHYRNKIIPPTGSPSSHLRRTFSYICATYADYRAWSHSSYAPSFYKIINIDEPVQDESCASAQDRVILAWLQFQEEEGGRPEQQEDKAGGSGASFSSESGESSASWHESVTKRQVWSQIVHVLTDDRKCKVYNDIFMPLIMDGDQLATQCQWKDA